MRDHDVRQQSHGTSKVPSLGVCVLNTGQAVTRRRWLGALAGIAGGTALTALTGERLWASTGLARSRSAPVMAYVYSTPHLGCCEHWVAHLERNGFKVTTTSFDDLSLFKRNFGVPEKLWSCHTSLVDNFVIEGHVPADLIRRLREHPLDIAGLAVAGMPCGAPGLEGPNPQAYEVVAFRRSGETFPYAYR